MTPIRKCNYYDPDPWGWDCDRRATYICAMDDGEPGATGVLSCFRCEYHKDECDIRSSVSYVVWYAEHIEGDVEGLDWDLT